MPINPKYQAWLDALLALARAEGEVTDVQADAISDFITAIVEAIDGEFTPMTIVVVWTAYKQFEGAKKPEKLGPKALKRLSEVEGRVTALEARLPGG